MTNRRSLQSDAARSSRAFQFVPGHVGGRVASAQPVRYRRHIGGIGSSVVPLPPTSLFVGGADIFSDAATSMTIPTFTAGTTSAVVLVAATGRNGFTAPTGWRVLAESTGSFGSVNRHGDAISQWAMLAADTATGTEGRTMTFPSTTGQEYKAISVSYAYFIGGGGGYWSCLQGAQLALTSASYPTTVPAGTAAWVQMCALAGVYAWGDKQGFTAGIGPMTFAHYPGAGTTAFNSASPKSSSLLINYTDLGAAGYPNSLSFAAVWAAG